MLITYSTENYRAWINLLLASFRKSNPKRRITIYCMGWDKEIIQSYKEEYPRYNFVYHKINKQIQKDVKAGKRSGTLLKLKPKLILQTMKEYKKPVLWIDADCVIVKDIKPILKILNSNEYDFLCTARFNKSLPCEKFNVTMLGFSYTKTAQKFLTAYNKQTQICKGYKGWFQEQLALWEIYNEKKPKLYKLNEKELSLGGDLASIIISRRVRVNIREIAKDFGIKIPKVNR